MTAMTQARSTIRFDASGAAAPPDQLGLSIGAGVVGWTGGIACFQPSTGYGVDASATTGLVAVGRWTKDFTNAGGAAGAFNVNVDQGTLKYLSGTGVDLITEADAGSICWVMDDQTVGLTNGGGTRSPAGFVIQVDADGGVWVEMGMGVAAAILAILGVGIDGTAQNYARAVITSLPGGYAGSTTGQLTASANGALGTQDGVATLAVGDVVLLPEGATNITANSDAGPYVITALGGTGAKYVLTRPAWWRTGSSIPTGAIKVGPEGTLFKGSDWKSFAVKGSNTIDSNAPALYPGTVSQSVALVAGTKAITNVPILAATSGVIPVRTTANTCTATTGGYALNGAATPGVLGTATVTVFATVAAGTINNADISTLTVTITNWT